MDISFIAMNRMCEEKASEDEEYRQQLEQKQKLVLSDGRALSDEELVAKLDSLGVPLSRDGFEAFVGEFLSAQEISKSLYESGGPFQGQDADWLWIALTCLWERWLPERPSLEMIDDLMQDGYGRQQQGDAAGACRLWQRAWQAIVSVMDACEMRIVNEFDERFCGSQCVFNWIQDYSMELQNAGCDEPRFLHESIQLSETVLERQLVEDSVLRNFRIGLADSYFSLGQKDKGDQLYSQWLEEDPLWTAGWVNWSDPYHIFARGEEDPERAKQLLRQGLDTPGIGEREWLLERLISICEETGEAEELGVARAELELERQTQKSLRAVQKLAQVKQEHERLERETERLSEEQARLEGELAFHEGQLPVGETEVELEATVDGRQLRIKEKHTFGGDGLPLEQFGDLDKSVRSDRAIGDHPTRVGRNSPCPCGSGRKYKKCCGR